MSEPGRQRFQPAAFVLRVFQRREAMKITQRSSLALDDQPVTGSVRNHRRARIVKGYAEGMQEKDIAALRLPSLQLIRSQ